MDFLLFVFALWLFYFIFSDMDVLFFILHYVLFYLFILLFIKRIIIAYFLTFTKIAY